MTIILSQQCESLTGTLGRGYGYCIESRRTKKGTLYHYAKRNSKGSVPPDGHWLFIVTCAQLAQNKLHIADIRVKREELQSALREAHHFVAADHLALSTYHARDILNLKTTFGL